MIVRFLSAAEDEAAEVEHWYDERLKGLGERFMGESASVLESIERDPEGLPLEETNPLPERDIRRAGSKKFPIRVVIELRGNEAIVLAVAHNARRPAYWIDRPTESGS